MVVVPLAASGGESQPSTPRSKADCTYWMRVAAAGALATSGVLLMAHKRKAGLAVAATGTALVILDQQHAVRELWDRLPVYIEEVHGILTRVQGAVEELSAQGERLRNILSR